MSNPKIIYEVPKLEKQISLFNYFLNLDEKFKNSLYLEYPELKRQKLDEYVTTLYTDKKSDLENTKNIAQQNWDRVADNILNEFTNILQKEWNLEIVPGGISLLPFSTRDLQEKRFDIYYKKDTGSILKTTTHELFHFIYFERWKELFPDTSIDDMDYPSPLWAFSEIALPIMLNRSKVKDILGIEFKNYPMFENENIVKHIENIYEEKNLDEFLKKSYEYILKYYELKNTKNE